MPDFTEQANTSTTTWIESAAASTTWTESTQGDRRLYGVGLYGVGVYGQGYITGSAPNFTEGLP